LTAVCGPWVAWHWGGVCLADRITEVVDLSVCLSVCYVEEERIGVQMSDDRGV